MKWQWKIGEYAGIGVYVHATFILLIGFVVLSHTLQGDPLSQTVAGVAFTLALFASVVLHEYGHALMAKRYGIKTRDITLYPIGGVARLERMPDKPIQEFWVAIAGPAMNVIIAAILFVWMTVRNEVVPMDRLSVTTGPFLERLMVTNISLVLFNLLPAFPMDGGRVLRALLAMRLEYVRATQIAATIGQGMALVFGFIGLFTNPFLVFIALFVWIGAAQEASMVQIRSALGGIPVNRAMLTDYRTLEPNDSLGHAVDLILAGSQQDFPVMANGTVVGVLTRDRVIATLAQRGSGTSVDQAMTTSIAKADHAEMLEGALMRMEEQQAPMICVTRAGQLVGIVTKENIGEFLMIQAALGKVRRGGLRPTAEPI